MTALALEIGTEGFAACLVADGVGIEDVRRVPIPDHSAWQACHDLLLEVADGAEIRSLGIACTGPIDMAAGVVAPAEISQWRAGFALVETARKAFPTISVQLALHGVCLALGEQAFGTTAGTADSFVMSVSDHISGGITVGGFAVVGRTGNAGNIGHVLVPGFDAPCECGGHGCLEAVAGGEAVCRWARSQGWRGESLAELVRTADHGDAIAIAALGRAGTALGRAIASVAALLDIDLVIIGGTMAKAGRAFWKPLGAAVADHARLSFLPGLRVLPSSLGEFAVLAGAAVLALTPPE